MPLEGEKAHHGGDVCVPVVTMPGSIYSTSTVDKGSTIWHHSEDKCIRFHSVFLVRFSFFPVRYSTSSH